MMEIGMRGKVALITGAAGDIGSAVARVFAAEGVHLALIDSNGAGLLTIASKLRDVGTVVSTATLDLTKPEEVSAGIEAVLAPHRGRVDVLINNAGICPPFQIEHLLDPCALPDWRAVYDVNFYGYLLTIMCVLPIMQSQGSGVIINNASDLAKQPVPEMLHYSTAKAAVVHLTQGLAPYLGQFNIRLVAVAPGPTRTAIWSREGGLMEFYAQKWDLPPEEATQQELRSRGMAIPRLAEPEEVASLMLYLATPLAASVTRCTFDINGGSHHAY
jgi:NAD(P)-dependent dehydrogenase (short-subunit alcohol dehydrogenase family)